MQLVERRDGLLENRGLISCRLDGFDDGSEIAGWLGSEILRCYRPVLERYGRDVRRRLHEGLNSAVQNHRKRDKLGHAKCTLPLLRRIHGLSGPRLAEVLAEGYAHLCLAYPKGLASGGDLVGDDVFDSHEGSLRHYRGKL